MTASPTTTLTGERAVIADRYEVIRAIARGGMSDVYLARQRGVDRLVAVKVLRPPDAEDADDDFDRRFRVEARALAGLNHPHIVTLYDFGEIGGGDGRCYLAMEYVDGPRFADLIKGGPMAPERVIRLMIQVCQALRYAHRQGVIHRDLKPSNLMVQHTDDGEHVKVVDFGLVRLVDADHDITRAGNVLGSPHCMAPEQVDGREADVTADVYAVGVLLFRALTGRYPFHGASSTATMVAHLHQPVPTFASVDPAVRVPAGLEDVVRRCLEKNPGQRYPSMDHLLVALAGLVEGPSELFRTGSLVAPAPVASEAPDDARWQRPVVLFAAVLGGLGLLAAGVAAALTVGRPANPANPPSTPITPDPPMVQAAAPEAPPRSAGTASGAPSASDVPTAEQAAPATGQVAQPAGASAPSGNPPPPSPPPATPSPAEPRPATKAAARPPAERAPSRPPATPPPPARPPPPKPDGYKSLPEGW